MNMRKALLIVVVAVLAAAAGAGAWALSRTARRAGAVAATVNGEQIRWSQVDAEVARSAAQFGIDPKSPEFEKQHGEIVKAMVDQLISARLIMQEAKKRDIVATDKDVEEQVAGIKKRFPSEAEYDAALARNGFTDASLREMIRNNIIQRKVAEVVAPLDVSDEEIRKQFDGNRTQYDQAAQIKVSHVLFRISEKDQETLAQAKAKIALSKLADGVKFEDVARQYSDDRASAERGGDLGWVNKGTLVKEFEQAAWAMKPGQTSGLVRTQFGLHIIRVSEVKEARKAELDKVKDQIREQLLAGKREKAFEAWLEEQKKTAKIERFPR